MSKVYLSGPITGLTYDKARYDWRAEFSALLFNGTALSPMRHEGHLAELKGPIEANGYASNLFSHPKMIVAKDFLDIKASEIMVVNLIGATRVSIGTMVEMGYAKALDKTIVTIMEEGNIHQHPFVTEISAVVCYSVEEAATIINSLLSTGI